MSTGALLALCVFGLGMSVLGFYLFWYCAIRWTVAKRPRL